MIAFPRKQICAAPSVGKSTLRDTGSRKTVNHLHGGRSQGGECAIDKACPITSSRGSLSLALCEAAVEHNPADQFQYALSHPNVVPRTDLTAPLTTETNVLPADLCIA